VSKIGIITNPHSKLNKRNPERQRLLAYIAGDQGRLEITNSLEDLDRAAAEFCKQGVGIVAINGGDGTISRTISALIHAYDKKPLPRLMILKGGTINVLATNLGIIDRPELTLYKLIEAQADGTDLQTVKFRTLKIGNMYGFLFGNGVVANYLKEFYKNKTGASGAVYLIIKLCLYYLFNRSKFSKIVHSQKYEIKSFEDSEYRPIESVAIMASTVEKMPLGARMFPQAKTYPNKFQAFILNMKSQELVWKLPLIMLKNKEGQFLGKLNFCTSGLEIKSSAPQLYTLDGELLETEGNALRVELGPELSFIVL
jgi:diacylglycerol kinase family enzyme